MTTTIRLIGAFCMALCLAFALPSDDLFAKKGKPGGKEKKEFFGQLTLHDAEGISHVLSDGKERTAPDNDGDDFRELDEVLFVNGKRDVIYQDHRIKFDPADDSTTHPDPCSSFGIADGGPNAGRVRALLDPQNCTIVEEKFLNDARTIKLVFDKYEREPEEGEPVFGSCACDAFSDAGLMVSGNTEFRNDDSNSCSLTLAAGPISSVETPPEPKGSSIQIIAYPFKEGKGKKGAAATSTGIHINFRVDDTGVPNGWGLWSEEEDISIDRFIFDDTRVVVSTGQFFKLIHFNVDSIDNPTCSGFAMPFEMTFKRFEVLVQ